MKIDYLYESGPFGSYKNKQSKTDAIKMASKDLMHIAKTAFVNSLSTTVGDLLKEHLDKNENMYLRFNMTSLTIIGKSGNKKSVYGCWNGINGSWNNAEDATPIFRLALENNTIVVIISCVPFNDYQVHFMCHTDWFDWITSLKIFLNSNINRITESGLPFSYDGFDVKIEIDPDVLDNDGRVNVKHMTISHADSVNAIQEFVDHFYNQNIRIKTYEFLFWESMPSNEVYQQYIERFPDLIRTTGSIYLDVYTMKDFDLENLNIISVLADPQSNVKISYELRLNRPGVSLQKKLDILRGIEKFVHNEYNMTLKELKEIAYQKRSKSSKLVSPEDIDVLKISYKYNNPKKLTIKGL